MYFYIGNLNDKKLSPRRDSKKLERRNSLKGNSASRRLATLQRSGSMRQISNKNKTEEYNISEPSKILKFLKRVCWVYLSIVNFFSQKNLRVFFRDYSAAADQRLKLESPIAAQLSSHPMNGLTKAFSLNKQPLHKLRR